MPEVNGNGADGQGGERDLEKSIYSDRASIEGTVIEAQGRRGRTIDHTEQGFQAVGRPRLAERLGETEVALLRIIAILLLLLFGVELVAKGATGAVREIKQFIESLEDSPRGSESVEGEPGESDDVDVASQRTSGVE